MIKFFRKIRQKMLTENKFSKYMIYAVGEIILVVIGILIALQINNWNSNRLEKESDSQLIGALITDLKLKNEELISDLEYGNSLIKNTDNIIEFWAKTKKIDTLNLKYSINRLGDDRGFLNEKSSVLEGLTNSGLWKRLPDSLIREIDDIYRFKLAAVKASFEKTTEYASHCKLNFLIPNGLADTNLNTLEIHSLVTEKNIEFISSLEVFRGGIYLLNNRFEYASKGIIKLSENLNIYKSEL
ncbi:hypothetical protein [Arenibacter palladensis]|uniref:hypothetical protein n=1 Tax=Arenibacter palladensis TaxID=237373 RepID=UPI0026E1DFEC|nr:hypothetical protein [Arenibacter palladensis]MDO6602475.1 hypothetical protein [Arenibacter palladensis]